MSWFATVHAEFLFETLFPFFGGEFSLFERSTGLSTKLTLSVSCVNFCCGAFFSNEFLNARGKMSLSLSSRGGIGSWCEHAEGLIQISSFID